MIAPLRHPLLLAKEWATLDLLSGGRLVVLPTVSWHRDEYAALGVDFAHRGAILDEQLEVLAKCWTGAPVEHHGEHFDIDPVWVSPSPYRPAGPAMWFGGQGMHPPLVRRLVRYGSGLNPFGPLADGDLAALDTALRGAGRSIGELELVGGVRAVFDDPTSVADVGASIPAAREQVARGFTTLCFKPSMFLDDPAGLPALVGRLRDEL